MPSKKPSPDFVLAEAFARQLLPQLCFAQPAQFFPEFWNSDPEAYANLLWERLATDLKLRGRTSRIIGTRIVPADGVAFFLVRFPVLENQDCPIGGAAMFRYRSLDDDLKVEAVNCFTLERRQGRALLREWEDRPTEYACVLELPLKDESETAFVGAILTKFIAEQSGNDDEDDDEWYDEDDDEPDDDQDGDEAEAVKQVFECWQAELPDDITTAILQRIEEPASSFTDCLTVIRGKHPGLPSFETLEKAMRIGLYRLAVVSYATGQSDREHLLPRVEADAACFDDLPFDAAPLLEPAMEPICDVIEQVFAILKDAGVPLAAPYKQRFRAVMESAEEVAISCLKSGIGTRRA